MNISAYFVIYRHGDGGGAGVTELSPSNIDFLCLICPLNRLRDAQSLEPVSVSTRALS